MEFLFLQLTSLIYGSSSCPPESFEVIRGQLMMKIFSLVKANQQFGKTIFETVKVFSLFSLIFFPHRAISVCPNH